MKTKYRIPGERLGLSFPVIKKVEVISETEKSITMVAGHYKDQTYCYHKRNRFYDFCDTFDEAKKTLLFKVDEEITDKKNEMVELVDLRAEIASLTE